MGWKISRTAGVYGKRIACPAPSLARVGYAAPAKKSSNNLPAARPTAGPSSEPGPPARTAAANAWMLRLNSSNRASLMKPIVLSSLIKPAISANPRATPRSQ